MKFKLIEPSCTLNIVLNDAEMKELQETGFISMKKEDRIKWLSCSTFEFVQFVNVIVKGDKNE